MVSGLSPRPQAFLEREERYFQDGLDAARESGASGRRAFRQEQSSGLICADELFGGLATPLLVRSNEGRPTKIEGNPDHPNNRNINDPNDRGTSATDLFAQASILTLYDPDRQQTLTYREEIRPWTAFVADINTALEGHKKDGGAGLRFLTETISSPTLASQLRTILTNFPSAKWHQYEPAGSNGASGGAI